MMMWVVVSVLSVSDGAGGVSGGTSGGASGGVGGGVSAAGTAGCDIVVGNVRGVGDVVGGVCSVLTSVMSLVPVAASSSVS